MSMVSPEEYAEQLKAMKKYRQASGGNKIIFTGEIFIFRVLSQDFAGHYG